MNIEPLGARVLIKPIEQDTVTASGIILPDTTKEKPQQGTIEAIGSEEEMTTDLSVGDKVLFPKYSGNEIKIEGEILILMDEADVLARVRD